MASQSSFDPTTLARFGKLPMIARTVVEGFLTGLHQSPFKGFSIEFSEHRQYYPGDEIRHIDWRAFGKTDRYYIKEYEEETNLKAYLLLDASGSMGYKGQGVSKFAYAQYVAASLAFLMLHQMDAVGLLLHDNKVRHMLPPRATSKHLQHLLSLLENCQPGGETSMAPLWHELANRLRRRGLIIVLSDCFDQINPLIHALRHFKFQGHEVLLFHILAPEEIEFPFSKWTDFRNLEIPQDHLVLNPQQVRRDYLQNFNAFCKQLREQLAHLQIDYHLMRTDEPVDRALGIYLSRRNKKK